jgi:hypothetical protein
MLSEKSVELNLTAELLAWLSWITGDTHTAIGPSQVEEANVGFDVSFHGGGVAAALVQYKRAYVDGATLTWRLNRTKKRDQHRRLQVLESLGYPVLYAFPFFTTPSELVARRKRLLLATAWFQPSAINPPGGPIGHHEVIYDVATDTWWVASPDRVQLDRPHTIDVLLEGLRRRPDQQVSVEEFAATINRIMASAMDSENADSSPEDADREAMQGQVLLIRASEPSQL